MWLTLSDRIRIVRKKLFKKIRANILLVLSDVENYLLSALKRAKFLGERQTIRKYPHLKRHPKLKEGKLFFLKSMLKGRNDGV